jgi:hypothetical protein
MSTSEQSQPAARRRGELHRSNGDRQVGQVMGARRRLNVLPLRAGLASDWREAAVKKRSESAVTPRELDACARARLTIRWPRTR